MTYIYNKVKKAASLTLKALPVAMALLALASCNEYLDKLPDDRAEVNTGEKAANLLVSAYPYVNNFVINELRSDNVDDNGRSYSSSVLFEELYRFKDVTDEGMDSPRFVWQGYYNSVATCNQVLASIEEMGGQDKFKAQAAEAKMIRAYSMLQLANTFCMAWNPEKADEYMGLPYPKEPEKSVNTQYQRGTLRELYANINQDIEEALPYIDDNLHSTAKKYHFTKRSAYALAARFNLYYLNFDKAVSYATEALGETPETYLRKIENYSVLGRADIANYYVNSSEPANLLLVASYSWAGRGLSELSYPRFHHNYNMAAYETFWADGPWGGGSSNNTLYWASMLYGNSQGVSFPKMDEFFEFDDKVNRTGQSHIVSPVLNGDETLLVRAEALALKGDLDNAVRDMNYWIISHCKEVDSESGRKRPVLTVDNIKAFVEELDYAPVVPETNRDRSLRKVLHPQGFTIDTAEQEDVLQLLLHMRRLETLFEGQRMVDLKRYGIEFCHLLNREDPLVFTAGDLRGAMQLPSDVINAGLPANPR